MDPKLIVNNILKDLYNARIALGLYAAILVLRFFLVSDPFAVIAPWLFIANIKGEAPIVLSTMTLFAMFIIMTVVTTSWIQADSLNDGDAFWTTRPAREPHLLAAKLAAFVLAFVLPPIVLDIVAGLMRGAGLSVLWGIANGLWFYGLAMAPILFLASVTPDMARMIVSLVALTGVSALWISATWGAAIQGLELPPSSHWEVWLVAILMAGFAGAYVFQSLRRNRKQSLMIATGAFILAPILAMPRLSDYKVKIFANAAAIEGVSLEKEDSLFGQPNRSRWRPLKLFERRHVVDHNPSRALVALRNESEVTTTLGGRQNHSDDIQYGSWHPAPFVEMLQNSGYAGRYAAPQATAMPEAQHIDATLLRFGEETPLDGFSAETVFKLQSWFAEYEFVSINSVGLERDAIVSKNKLISVLSAYQLDRKALEPEAVSEDAEPASRKLSLRLQIQESRFPTGLDHMLDRNHEVEQKEGIVRLYFLYDPLNGVGAIGWPQFNPHRKFHLDRGSPLFGPSLQKRYKSIGFEFIHSHDKAIDPERLQLIALDVRKTGHVVHASESSTPVLSRFVSQVREKAKANSHIDNWMTRMPID